MDQRETGITWNAQCRKNSATVDWKACIPGFCNPSVPSSGPRSEVRPDRNERTKFSAVTDPTISMLSIR